MIKKNKFPLVAIVAVSRDFIIGDGNKMLWHLPNDLKRLKSITLGNPLIMGRKTFDSIGKPLPERANIILTNKKNLKETDFESVFILYITNQLLKLSLNLFILRGSASNTENSFPEESVTTSPREGIRLVILNTKPPIVSYSSPFLLFVKSTPA